MELFHKILLLSFTVTFVHGHGRLVAPMTRKGDLGYENDPSKDTSQSDPLRATGGTEWVCRHSAATTPTETLTAGAVHTFDYRLTARHVGDCDFSISYDHDKSLADMRWFKIANFPNCKDQGTMVSANNQVDSNRVQVTMPSWLKSGRAVVRWGWWGIHNHPTVEFFNQCADVNINGVANLPQELVTFKLPGVYPNYGTDGVGYRNEWNGEKWGTDKFWMTGPACAMDSDLNNCQLTAPGTQGHVSVSGVTSGPVSTTEAVTTIVESTTASGCSQFVSKDGCLTDQECQTICGHQNGVVCPWNKCKCDESTTSTSTTTVVETTTSASTSTSSTTSSTSSTSTSNIESTNQVNSQAVNLIGYYGNSGSCADSGCTPTFDEIPSSYNVIIMTFLNINDAHELVFAMSNNAPVTLNNLASEAAAWKSKADPWGRQKLVLVSLGGQNGHWPSDISDADVVTKLKGFMQTYGFDGLDIDFEHSVVQYVEKNIEAFRQLKSEGFVLCAAPEAAQVPLNAYRPILADLDWVHPQFYNNPPNAVTTPFVPQYEAHANWQTPSNQPWWLVTMDTTATLVGMSANARGIAIPATSQAAGSYNNWDLNLLASQVRMGDIRNVATWALGYDKTNNWQLAQTIAALNNNDNSITTQIVETTTTQAASCVNVKQDSECEQANTTWTMCTTGGDWWKNQCKKTCGIC